MRGVTADISFDNWAKQFFELVKGDVESSGIFRDRPDTSLDYRRDVRIHHLNRKGQIVKTYSLFKAFPIEYEPASSFGSDGDDVLSMEKLVLSYESFNVTSTAATSNPNDPRDIIKRVIGRF